MSNQSTCRSMAVSNNQDYTAEPSSNRKAPQQYSALDVYLRKDEHHEQVVLGHGTCCKKEAAQEHTDKMKGHIKELSKDLPK